MRQARQKRKYTISHNFVYKIFNWIRTQDYYCFLDGNGHATRHGSFPKVLFVGMHSELISNDDSFANLESYQKEVGYAYGYLSYNLKNEIEDLASENPSSISYHNLHFISPKSIIWIEDQHIIIESFENPDSVFFNIEGQKQAIDHHAGNISSLKCLTTKNQYVRNIQKIKNAIVDGEFYEMNYCIEYLANALDFDPIWCYLKLNEISPMPFSGLLKMGSLNLICASPERFIKKSGDILISQPIKGTIRRSYDKTEDERLKGSLRSSEKEKAENMMIVDLVRNDLAKSSVTGTVQVTDLFGLYTFKKVHQMISTIESRFSNKIPITDIIKNAFPMGSMTGAPKVRVMQEIENLEDSSRGLYSGSLGFFDENGNFDFNVVIRSIIYDQATNRLSFHVGSAITYDSNPEYEYNECLLKAEALFEVLSR